MGRRIAVAGSHPANRMVAVAIVVMTLVFIMLLSRAFYGGRTVGVATPAPERDVTARAHVAEADSDSDGLADWEEDLWGTDPHNPDSDGDGVLDGAERANGQNPSGIGDTELFALDVTASENITATQAVGRELFGTFMQEFTQNPNLSPAEQQAIVDDALAELVERANIPSYTREEVQIVEATTDTRTAYVEAVRTTLRTVQENNPTEYTALGMLTQGNKAQAIAELTRSAELYRVSAEVLAHTKTPDDIVDAHVMLVGGLYRYAASLTQVTKLEQDPAIVVLGLNIFTSAQTELAQSMAAIIQYSGYDIRNLVMPQSTSTVVDFNQATVPPESEPLASPTP